MKKRSKKITSATLFIFCILFIFMTGYTKGGAPKNISENEIYPKGYISKASVFDASNNEKAVSLNKLKPVFSKHRKYWL